MKKWECQERWVKEPMNLTLFTFQGREVRMNRGVALIDNCSREGVYLKGGNQDKVKETLTSPVPQQQKICPYTLQGKID